MAFHVLTPKAVPDVLTSGCESPFPANSVLCKAEVGNRREAISYERCMSYANDRKLRVTRLCKACAKKLGIRREKRDGDD